MSKDQAVPEERLAKAVALMFEALREPGCPDEAICSHHGVGGRVGDDSVSVVPRGNGTLVTVYRSYNLGEDWEGYTKAEMDGRKAALAEALDAPIVDEWNGEEGHNGFSVVLGVDCPEHFRKCILRYGALDDVFAPNKGYDAFNEWWEGALDAVGYVREEYADA